jgi:putative transposase
MAEEVNALYKTELHRNPAALTTNGGPWRGLADLEIATSGGVAWFNEERLRGELDDLTPAEVEDAYYSDQSQATAAGETNPTSTRKTRAGSERLFSRCELTDQEGRE